jgi:head-tail adaptor
MSAGALRHRIDIQRQVSVPDGAGGETTTWTALKTFLPARVTPVGASPIERVYGDTRVEAAGTSEVIMRWFSDLRATDRVIYQGHALMIRGLENVGSEGQYWRLTVVEDLP